MLRNFKHENIEDWEYRWGHSVQIYVGICNVETQTVTFESSQIIHVYAYLCFSYVCMADDAP
jgi:hypothetical protein